MRKIILITTILLSSCTVDNSIDYPTPENCNCDLVEQEKIENMSTGYIIQDWTNLNTILNYTTNCNRDGHIVGSSSEYVNNTNIKTSKQFKIICR